MQYLEINYPSLTTISYTISDRRKPNSKFILAFPHLIRFLVVIYLVTTAIAKARTEFPFVTSHIKDTYFNAAILNLPPVEILASNTRWWMLALFTAVSLYLSLKRHYTEESLLVLQGLGVQTSTSASYHLMAPQTTFIPTTEIQDIVIHEAFKGLGVRFYLAIIVKNAPEVVVVFPKLLPRRHVLEEVWRGARKCLYAGR